MPPTAGLCGVFVQGKESILFFPLDIKHRPGGEITILLLGWVSAPSIQREDGDHGGSRQRRGARGVQGPWELGVQKEMLKGERNTSIKAFKEMDQREGEL